MNLTDFTTLLDTLEFTTSIKFIPYKKLIK